MINWDGNEKRRYEWYKLRNICAIKMKIVSNERYRKAKFIEENTIEFF